MAAEIKPAGSHWNIRLMDPPKFPDLVCCSARAYVVFKEHVPIDQRFPHLIEMAIVHCRKCETDSKGNCKDPEKAHPNFQLPLYPIMNSDRKSFRGALKPLQSAAHYHAVVFTYTTKKAMARPMYYADLLPTFGGR